jgi:hypothetical protein
MVRQSAVELDDVAQDRTIHHGALLTLTRGKILD